jgi:hypothetical protein
MDKQYIVEDIRKEEVVIVSIVWIVETISLIKVYSLSLEQTTKIGKHIIQTMAVDIK